MPDRAPIVAIQCRCGRLRGKLSLAGLTNRCVCYCADCQAFARHLRAVDAMDAQGGTEIIQLRASNLAITHGLDQLGCLRLTDTGMLRWYATCCGTPIGNTLANWKVCFVGLIRACVATGDDTLGRLLGPVAMRVGVDSAQGAPKPAASGALAGIAKVIAVIAAARISGAHRRSVFFDPRSGAPVATPHVLSLGELAEARHDV